MAMSVNCRSVWWHQVTAQNMTGVCHSAHNARFQCPTPLKPSTASTRQLPHLQHLPQNWVQSCNVLELYTCQSLLARSCLAAGKLLGGTWVLLKGLDVKDAAAPEDTKDAEGNGIIESVCACHTSETQLPRFYGPQT